MQYVAIPKGLATRTALYRARRIESLCSVTYGAHGQRFIEVPSRPQREPLSVANAIREAIVLPTTR